MFYWKPMLKVLKLAIEILSRKNYFLNYLCYGGGNCAVERTCRPFIIFWQQGFLQNILFFNVFFCFYWIFCSLYMQNFDFTNFHSLRFFKSTMWRSLPSLVSSAVRLVDKSKFVEFQLIFASFRSQNAVNTRFSSTMKQFFDDEANFGKAELRPKHRPGRSWTAEELRLKSNSDLHKLW